MALKLTAPPAPPEGGGDFPKLGDYLGQIVILGPTEETTVKTPHSDDSKCTRCIGWAWAGGKLEDLGTVLVFWARVRAQLHDAIATGDYVVGRLVKDGRSFILERVTTTETLATIEKQLAF